MTTHKESYTLDNGTKVVIFGDDEFCLAMIIPTEQDNEISGKALVDAVKEQLDNISKEAPHFNDCPAMDGFGCRCGGIDSIGDDS